MSQMNNNRDNSIERVEGLLDELGRRERAEAPATLEDRLFMATRGVLVSHAKSGRPSGEVRTVAHAARPRWFVGALRVAAVVGLVVTAGVVYRAVSSSPALAPTPPGPVAIHSLPQPAAVKLSEKELDELVAVLAMNDDRVAEEVHSISSDAERVSGSLIEVFSDAFEG